MLKRRPHFGQGELARAIYLNRTMGVNPSNIDINWRVLRIRIYKWGHSFTEIDGLSVSDVGDISGYLSGNSKADEKERKKRRPKPRVRGRRR